jgi:hypothetical protein
MMTPGFTAETSDYRTPYNYRQVSGVSSSNGSILPSISAYLWVPAARAIQKNWRQTCLHWFATVRPARDVFLLPLRGQTRAKLASVGILSWHNLICLVRSCKYTRIANNRRS